MSTQPKHVFFGLLILAIVIAVAIFWPRKPGNAGPPELADEQVWLPGGGVINEPYVKVDAKHQRLVERIQEKQAVAQALIHGETTLPEAAARFQAIHSGDPSPLAILRSRFPRATTDELWYRHVIQYVQGYSRSDPDRVPQLVKRLEAEVTHRFSGAFGGPGPAEPKVVPESSRGPEVGPIGIVIGGGERFGRHPRRR